MRETDLYPSVKGFLTAQGYDVKGEIADCDVVGIRDDGPPVIVELKLRFTLDLVLQGIDRQKLSDHVYLAMPPMAGRGAQGRMRGALGLCRRLGLGLMTVSGPGVQVLLDPAPYTPRKVKPRQGRLLREFQRRVGDPAAGGADRSRPGMTSYRQDALRCALHLSRHGPTRASAVAAATGVGRARAILYRDVYGWFERTGTGIYGITPLGIKDLELFADVATELDRTPG